MWYYKNKQVKTIEDIPKDVFGFIYEVYHIPTGKKYIGKKQLMSNRTLPPLKGQKRKRKVVKESDWKTYYGSQKEIKELVKESKQEEFRREILQFCFTKKQLTYYELKWQFAKGVLESDEYLNDNLMGKFFKRDLDNQILADHTEKS